MKKVKALYCGSFDPVTFGHLDVIQRAATMFSRVVVAVAENPRKSCMFSYQERITMMKRAVDLIRFSGSDIFVADEPIRTLTADYARINGYDVIIKGARTGQDFDYEKLIHEVSLTQQRNLDTVLLFSSAKFAHVSSSAAKELARFQGLIHGYVPIHVKSAIEEKLGQRIIGVTGTIGSGKSTFCKKMVLATPPNSDRPTHHINLDEIGHELLSNKVLPIAVETQDRIEAWFGTRDRKKLGEIVFGNQQALEKLNELFREPMLTLLRDKLHNLKGTILVEGALLTEMKWLFLCNNQVVLVKTPSKENHAARLFLRGHTQEQIDRRVESQYTYEEKMMSITNAICNDGFGKCVVYDTENHNPAAEHFVLGTENKVQ